MDGVASRGSDQYVIRFPDGMRSALKASARANGRSINSEIIHRLSTWRAPSSSGQIVVEVDGSQVEATLRSVNQLRDAAEQAFDACQKLGIKIGGAE